MLKVDHISSGYGKKQVLSDVSLEVKKGEVVLLTGGNGSGKSTLLKCIYNLLPLWEGVVLVEGERISGFKPSDLIRKGIVYIPQKDSCFENLSVKENLQISGSIYGRKHNEKKIEDVFNMIPTLKYLKSRNTINLSGGEKKLLSLGIGLMHEPKFILFDEPISGLDRINQKEVETLINRLNISQNISLLIVEHKSSNLNYQNIVQL